MTTVELAPPPVGTKLRSPLPYLVAMAATPLLAVQGVVLHHVVPLLIGLLLVVENLAFGWWFGVTLAEREALVDGLRRRRIPWGEIQGVSVERYLAATRVVIWTPTRKVRLRAPITSWGIGRKQFERDYHALGQFWVAHRGADWQPQPWRGRR